MGKNGYRKNRKIYAIRSYIYLYTPVYTNLYTNRAYQTALRQKLSLLGVNTGGDLQEDDLQSTGGYNILKMEAVDDNDT